MQNSSGNFINPDIKSVSAAAKGEIPADTRIMVTNSSDPEAYPISGFTWIILYKEQAYNGRSIAQAEAKVKFLDWLVSPEAQAIAESVNYAASQQKYLQWQKKFCVQLLMKGNRFLNRYSD